MWDLIDACRAGRAPTPVQPSLARVMRSKSKSSEHLLVPEKPRPRRLRHSEGETMPANRGMANGTARLVFVVSKQVLPRRQTTRHARFRRRQNIPLAAGYTPQAYLLTSGLGSSARYIDVIAAISASTRISSSLLSNNQASISRSGSSMCAPFRLRSTEESPVDTCARSRSLSIVGVSEVDYTHKSTPVPARISALPRRARGAPITAACEPCAPPLLYCTTVPVRPVGAAGVELLLATNVVMLFAGSV